MTREAGVTVGAVVVIGVAGRLAVELASGGLAAGFAGAEGRWVFGGVGWSQRKHPLTVAAASPAVPANCSNRRRLTAWPLLD